MTNAILPPAPNDLDQPTHERIVKRFITQQAAFAMLGVELLETGFDDDVPGYCLREGKVRHVLTSLDEADAILSAMRAASPEVGQVKPPGGVSANDDLFAELLPEARMAEVKKRLLCHGRMIEKEVYGQPSWLRVFFPGSQRSIICRNLEEAERFADRLDQGAK